MRIGELAERTGTTVRALRYYEERGLLRPARTSSGQRVYTADAVERVDLLRRFYAAGLGSSTIAELLPCVDHPTTAASVDTVALMTREHERIGAQIAELTTTRHQLAELIHATAVCTREMQAQSA